MKALIYNELFKIFHKKITWFFIIFVISQYCFNVVFIKVNNHYLDNLDKNRVDYLVKKHNSMGQEANKDLEFYISERNEIDNYELYKDYDRLSWQRYIIDTEASKYVSCMNYSKLKNNDEKRYNDCKNSLDELMNKVKNNTWRDFVHEYLDDAVNNLKQAKELYDNEKNEIEKKSIEITIKSIELEIDGYNYHLNNNIPIDYTDDSVMIDDYVSLATEQLTVEEDETKYKDYYELLEKRKDENRLYTARYKIDHKYKDITNNTSIGLFINYTCVSVNVIVLIYMIVVGGNLVADEFSKGTIKLLLVRPYERRKMLLSKYIATIISTFLFFLFYLFVIFISCGIAYGFKGYFIPVVVYDFSNAMIREMGLFTYAFINYLSFVPLFLILLSLTFFLGVFLHNEAMTVGIPIVVYVVSLFLNYSTSSKIMKYFPTLCWNLKEFLWGGLPTFKELTFGTSLFVCICTFVIITWGSFSVFKSRDIKNQ